MIFKRVLKRSAVTATIRAGAAALLLGFVLNGCGGSSCALDPEGNIYVVDHLNHRVVRFQGMGGTNWIPFGTQGSGTGQFDRPWGIWLDALDRIYVAEIDNHRIVRFDDMAGSGWTAFGSLGAGVNQFNNPLGIFVDGLGRIYVADHLNHRIVRMDDMSGTGWT